MPRAEKQAAKKIQTGFSSPLFCLQKMEPTTFILLLLMLLTGANTAAVVWYVFARSQHRIDVGRISGVMAADLLERGDAETLTEGAIRAFVRERYATMCALFGLPMSAADVIADRVVAYVAQATGEPPPQWAGELRGLYD